MDILDKECTTCGEIKKTSEYTKRAASKDGLASSCKVCLRKRDNDRYRNDPRVKERQKIYAKSDKGKAAGNKAKKKYIEKNLIKRAAKTIVGNAVRDGKLIKPKACESCGATPNRLHGHHDDYARPLDVRWLCPGCHNKWHKINGEGKNAT